MLTLIYNLIQITLFSIFTNLAYFGINYWLYKWTLALFNPNVFAKIFGVIWLGWAIIFGLNYLVTRKIWAKEKGFKIVEQKISYTLDDIFLLGESLKTTIQECLHVVGRKEKYERVLFFLSDSWKSLSQKEALKYVTKEATFFVPKEKPVLFEAAGSFQAKGTAKNLNLTSAFPLVKFLQSYGQPFSLKKILTDLNKSQISAEMVEEIKTRLKILGVNYVWPFFFKDTLAGILCVKTKGDFTIPDELSIKNFFELLTKKMEAELGFEKETSEYQKIFFLSGQLSDAYKELTKSKEEIKNLDNQLKISASQKKELEEKLTETNKLRGDLKLESKELEKIGQEISSLENQNALLKKENQGLAKKMEGLLESNRSLVSSTANFSSVSKDLYEANKSVRETKNYLESLLERMSNGVVGINTEGKIITYNRQMNSLTGLPEEEVLEKVYVAFLKRVFQETEKISDFIKTAFRDGKSFLKFETKIHKPAGGEIPVNLVIVPLRGEEKEILGVMMVVVDLTESKKLENETTKRSRLESIQQLTVSLNHEINNPLTSVLCNVQFVLKKIKEDTSLGETTELVESLFIAEKESKRIKKILEDLRKINEPTTKEYLPGVEMLDIPGSIKEKESQ